MDLHKSLFKDAVKYLGKEELSWETPTKRRIETALKKIHRDVFKVPGDLRAQHDTVHYLLTEGVELKNIPREYTILVLIRYLLEVMKRYQGEGEGSLIFQSVFGATMLVKARSFQLEAFDHLNSGIFHPIRSTIMDHLQCAAQELEELYLSRTDPDFGKIKTLGMMELVKEELIAVTCHPRRVQWWMDEEEKKELGF